MRGNEFDKLAGPKYLFFLKNCLLGRAGGMGEMCICSRVLGLEKYREREIEKARGRQRETSTRFP